jgi:ribosomal protein L25 (general stress protein Ctc)
VAGRVPAVLYGREFQPVALTVDRLALDKVVHKSSNALLDLKGPKQVEGRIVLLKDVQRDPVKRSLIHCDFLVIDPRRPITVSVPLHFLGKPKVMTLNNKPAIIQVAATTAVALQQTQSAAGAGGAGTATSAVTVERVVTGLVLRVTPQVNKDGYVTMLVQPTFTDTAESSLSSQRQRVFDPITRGASTLVRVKNGQTLVLGGLLQSNETKAVRKVPFLGYIPLLGWLFTSTSTRRINSDLVIFITPTIVSD